jgi:hypothetical protein
MKHQRSLVEAVVGAALLFLIFAEQADAYIDPGSGSYILQLILAGLLGAGVAVKIYWKRIKGAILRTPSEKPEEVDGSQ